MDEREPKRIEKVIEGFIVYPSPDEGAHFLITQGLSEKEIKAYQTALVEFRNTGHFPQIQPLIEKARETGRLVAFDYYIGNFRRIDESPVRLRLIIEDLSTP
ncbi:hypothetical protein HYU92_06635 [Candidatus Curtissbacteria bacterium]|nr:hypothetical protein [Candidatus Curtissbacteria bacterium]